MTTSNMITSNTICDNCKSKSEITRISMWFITLKILLIFSLTSAYVPKRIDIASKNKITIGGLFPVHNKGKNETAPCGAVMAEKGIQRLEAMLYAIDEINRNPREWGFNLGAMILDTCSSDSFTLEQALQFLQINCGDSSSKRKVAGIVGASNSAVSEAVANIFRLFKIPQVSYASTSEELDNMHKYPYFFRVVPSDKFQVQAMLDLLIHFQWTYVSAVISRGDYGELALKTLEELVDNVTAPEICFAEVHTIPRDPTEEDYDNAIDALMRHHLAKVVIVFLNEDKVKHLLTAARRLEVPLGRFVWLGSDGWGAKIHPVRGNEDIAKGAITLLPKRFPVEVGFDDYFLSLTPKNNTRNIWFKEFWEHQFNCSFSSSNNNTERCTGDESLRDVYHQEGLVPMVIDSVTLIATAIKSVCMEKPQYCRSSYEKDTLFRRLLKDHIPKAHFNSSQGNNMVIKFDQERNIPTYYKIYQFKMSAGKYGYKEIGEWSLNNVSRLRMSEIAMWGDSESVVSTCSRKCNKGEERRVKNPNKRCCWDCHVCSDGEYVPHERGHCTPCPAGFISNFDRTACMELELDYIGRDLKSSWALVPLSFSIFGLVCTFIVLVVFLLYHKTPIIMAAGRELCYFILLGVALCYSFTFVVLQKPTEVSCGVLRIGMGLGLSICYAAIFTKTNRISRIFNRSLRITKRPSYISPESQLVICSCLILIQIILTVMWLIITPPTVKYIMLSNPRAYVSICGFDGTSVILALFYNMILIILCTYYAYKTRNIPENFNESKYISFMMYASCIDWLAFIPIYYCTWQDHKVQATILCMCVSISGSATLACLFLPKVHIVLFHPEKNVRYPNSSPTSSTPSINITPVRFMISNQNSPASPQRSPKLKKNSPASPRRSPKLKKNSPASPQESPKPKKNSQPNNSTDNNFLMVNQPSPILKSVE